MKHLFFFLGILTLSLSVQSQVVGRQRHEGYYINKDGEKIEGIIEIWASDEYPWQYQSKVKYFPKEELQKKRVKNKYKTKLKPKNIKGYGFNDGRYWESIKVTDGGSVGAGMIPKRIFCLKVVDGKLNVYKYYSTPIQSGIPASIEADEKKCRTPRLKVWKEGTKKVRDSESVNIQKYINDCESILKKYLDGDYGYKPKELKEKKGFGKLVGAVNDRYRLKTIIIQLAQDYNEAMK